MNFITSSNHPLKHPHFPLTHSLSLLHTILRLRLHPHSLLHHNMPLHSIILSLGFPLPIPRTTLADRQQERARPVLRQESAERGKRSAENRSVDFDSRPCCYVSCIPGLVLGFGEDVDGLQADYGGDCCAGISLVRVHLVIEMEIGN